MRVSRKLTGVTGYIAACTIWADVTHLSDDNKFSCGSFSEILVSQGPGSAFQLRQQNQNEQRFQSRNGRLTAITGYLANCVALSAQPRSK